jgi:hypothetical protein
MSRQSKKPNQQLAQKVSNYKLLPNIFSTEPNKKMLDSTLDVMTSKGQLLPFKETYGLRSASNRPEEFFKVESNEVRRESQANNMLVIADTDNNYSGKSSYIDIENYLNIKGAPLKDGVILDKDINVLEFPINPIRLTDYNLFYWIANDMPACRIHANPGPGNTNKYNIVTEIINRPFAKIKDDLTGQTLELQNGMTVYFTGNVDTLYQTVDENYPKLYYVYGVGDGIALLPATAIDKRIPDSWLKKRPWDKTNEFDDPPAIKWDSETWDGSMIVTSEPEYITQEKTSQPNHWQVIDHWYHINTIKAVAKFLGASLEEFVTVQNKAKRPIITFIRGVKIYNWPSTTKAEIKSILPYTKNVYQSPPRTTLKDGYGYTIQNNDLVVFEGTPGVYRASGVGTGIIFTDIGISINENDGALIIAKTDLRYHRAIYKNDKWQLAQNKTTPNQNLLFQFHKSDNVSLEDLNETQFEGGIILGFKDGNTYDRVLAKNIKVSSIDFDLIDENNPSAVSPNQLKFITDVDASYSYSDLATGEIITLAGPYGYNFYNRVIPFYQNRKGLNFTKQSQDLKYESLTEEPWSGKVSPIASGFDTIHAYYDNNKSIRFYFDVTGYGLVEFSSKKGFNAFESLIPLTSGGIVKIVCHDLPGPITFFKTELINNITTPVLLEEPYCVNNGISNGIIELDLSDSIFVDSSYIDNELYVENTRLMWTFATSLYKTAIVKPINKWRFLQDVYAKDQTNPIFNEYEYVISDITLSDGSLDSNQQLIATDSLGNKIKSGDKVVVNSIVTWPTTRTAPISLTVNPLNQKLSEINYYSLYQHATNIKSNSTNIRESIDSESLLQTTFLGGSTLLKHNEPLSKFAITSTNMPFDLGDLLIRQGKHYDSFLNKLKVELESVINSVDETAYSSHDLLTMAISKIYVTTADSNTFWTHSNMMGWGEKLDNYREENFEVISNLTFDLVGDFENISHRAGKEYVLHLTLDAGLPWFDLASTSFGLFEATATGTSNWVSKNPIIITDLVDTVSSLGIIPNTNVGINGDYAVVATSVVSSFQVYKKISNSWVICNNSSLNKTIFAAAPIPSATEVGDLWIKTTTQNNGLRIIIKKYTAINSAGQRQWVPQNVPVYANDSSATNGYGNSLSIGKIYARVTPNTANISIKVYDGESWVLLKCQASIDEPQATIKRYLKRDVDYVLVDGTNEYTAIRFNENFIGKTINIKQWYGRYKAQIPASLAKIGLAPVYMPEILEDTTIPGKYFMHRHDGTRFYLEDGVDINNYPANTVEQLMYEYELAVWSSVTQDIKTNSFRNYVENIPGYFRLLDKGLGAVRQIMLNEAKQWLNQNNLFLMANNDYDVNNGFTYIYKLGTGEDVYSITGSWRLIYQFLFDTDRPHTHPWEMLGHTLKPSWWDANYSWTNSTKRVGLEKALRTGNIGTPTNKIINPKFARCNDLSIEQEFPVDITGDLLPPDQLSWLWLTIQDADASWLPGEVSPYENVFYNTQWGIAAKTKMWYLRNPAQYINTNWVPGQTIVNEWGNKLDRNTLYWQQGNINHDYHRKVVDGETVYTSGIESLFSEFCILNNKDYKAEVIDKFNNIKVKKEFLLNGFTNKDNVRIQSTSINSQRITLFVPEESYDVRTINHYPDREIFYSGVRIIWDGEYYSVTGFATEDGYITAFIPADNSSTTPITIGDVTFKQKNTYTTELYYQNYGERYKNRQDVFDLLIGYGKYLESIGFVFEEPEGGDIRDWQLSAKQFVFWSNAPLATGSYIDLNPCADQLVIKSMVGHLDNLEGTNENVGQCVDRNNKPLFSKDLLVNRFSDNNTVVIKTKNANRSIYGIKLTFSSFETVVHLNSTSVFDDVYFLPEQSTTKRSFVIGGKKSQAWDGTYYAPGYVITSDGIIPNYDTMAEQGRNLLDVENVILDSTVAEAARAQFGLNRNPELRQLFLQEENETLFKNAITYTKGTVEVFNKLAPLTHNDESQSKPYEEYMVRLGEIGNTKNIEYYEFEMLSSDIRHPSKTSQVVKFIDNAEPTTNDSLLYFKNNSKRWVHRPFNKDLAFNTYDRTYRDLATGGPLFTGDTDLTIDTLDGLANLYDNFAELWNIPAYNEIASYKQYDQVRINGKLYYAKTTVSPNTWSNNNDKFSQIDEPYLPNIFVSNYYKPNPDLANSGMSIFKPGTWQVLQTVDRELSVLEICPGPDDFSKARATTNKAHKLSVGDYVLIVNASLGNTSIDGIWQIQSLGEGPAKETQFFINARLGDNCYTGKIFTFKPVRFKNHIDYRLATGLDADMYGYSWKKKYNPFTNAIGQTVLDKTDTPSGYSPTWPIAMIDDSLGLDKKEATYDYGNYAVYDSRNWNIPLKEESQPVDPSDIEHLIIYDYAENRTVAKLDLFDPKKMYIPDVFKNDIDVINRVDPAKYNRSTDAYKSVYTSLGWHEECIGRRWWDLSTVQFSDYESGDELTKEKYWGTTVNGKLPDVYEWTKSPVPPSQWNKMAEKGLVAFDQVASGEVYVDIALNADNYHWVEEEDYINGETYTVYYFWVKNKNVIAEQSKQSRIYTTEQLSKVLLNPSAAGIPWWAPISNNAIVLKGIQRYLNNTSTVVQIKKKIKGNEKHQQWIFISEDNTVETIPEWLHVRLRDSLSAHIFYRKRAEYVNHNASNTYTQDDLVKYNGYFYVCRYTTTGSFNADAWQKLPIQGHNQSVTYNYLDIVIYNDNIYVCNDTTVGTWNPAKWQVLPAGSLSVRDIDPTRNTLDFNITKNVPDIFNLHPYGRLGNLVRPYIQSWFDDTIEARRTFIKKLNEIMMNVNVSNIDAWGDTRLNNEFYVVGDEIINVPKFWSYIDYQSETFDSTKEISLVLESTADIYTTTVTSGSYIKVNTGIRDYTIYEKNVDGSFGPVYKTKGAIEFTSDLYAPWSLSSYDTVGWDKFPWDYDLNSVYNAILDSLRYEIFTGQYSKYYSKIMCTMFRYVMSEQIGVDWLAKSSTVEPVNLISSTLEIDDYLQRDQITVLTNFYNTVKSYRDKIRGGTVNRTVIEPVEMEISEELMIYENGVLILNA